jgi:hypothetical protein
MKKTNATELDEVRVDILKHAYTSEAEWIRDRREREYQIFSWVNSIFIVIIGALIVVNPTNRSLDIFDKTVLSLAVTLLAGASYVWQRRSRNEVIAGARILSGILDYLHLREPGYFGNDAVFSPLSKNIDRDSLRRKIGLTLYNGTTLLMAMLTLVVVWTR